MAGLRGLLFDVGGTLVPNEFAISEEEYRQLCIGRLSHEYGSELPWFRALVSHEFVNNGVDPATLQQDVAGAVTGFLSALGVSIPPGNVPGICRACAVPLPPLVAGAETAVREAQALGLRLAICTNVFWRDDAAVAEDWRAFGLADCFDAYVTSHSVGFAKPHPAIFERALAAIGVEPAGAAIVGDRLREDMAGGRAAGLRTIWVRPPDADDPPGPMPEAVIGSIGELAPILRAWVAR